MKKNIIILFSSLLLVLLLFGAVSAEDGVNLALGAEVKTSTSVDDFGWFAEFVTNGMRGFDEKAPIRGWSSAILYFNPEIASDNSIQWIKIDLGDVHQISQVHLYPRPADSQPGEYFPIDFEIQVATDASAWDQDDESDAGWTTVVTQTDVERPMDAAVQAYSFDAVAARYVRVKATKLYVGKDGYVVQLAEIEVYQ